MNLSEAIKGPMRSKDDGINMSGSLEKRSSEHLDGLRLAKIGHVIEITMGGLAMTTGMTTGDNG